MTTETRHSVAVWFELPATDFDRSCAFWQAVMGTTLKGETMGPMRMAVFHYEKPNISGAVIAGLVGMRVATTPEQYLAWNLATLGGSAVGISGLIAGTFPAAKAGRLERSPSAVMEPGRARSLAQEHNDALQAKLGVTPQEAWLLELGDDR